MSVLSRRQALRLVTALPIGWLAGCDSRVSWHATDVSNVSPPLQFAMTRARDDRPVTQRDYRGRVVALYFGYTFCPDLCPTTLANLASVLTAMGADAKRVSVLFVTVDPQRDTLPVLAAYAKAFAPEIDGLRGTPDQLAAIARRYRVAYSVRPAAKDEPYEVDHSSAIYVFDGMGAARLLVSSLSTAKPDLDGTQADLTRLTREQPEAGLFGWLRRAV